MRLQQPAPVIPLKVGDLQILKTLRPNFRFQPLNIPSAVFDFLKETARRLGKPPREKFMIGEDGGDDAGGRVPVERHEPTPMMLLKVFARNLVPVLHIFVAEDFT